MKFLLWMGFCQSEPCPAASAAPWHPPDFLRSRDGISSVPFGLSPTEKPKSGFLETGTASAPRSIGQSMGESQIMAWLERRWEELNRQQW